MITGIAHVCIGSPDLGATARFYCEGLGFRKKFDFIRNGEVAGFYLEAGAGAFVEVFRNDRINREGTPPIMHLCLETDDIDNVRRQLKKAGFEVTEKAMGADNSWQCWTKDPAGVSIEFHEYTAESSQKTGADCVLG